MATSQSTPTIMFKFVLVGDSGVGKSSLLFRFAENTFTDSFINTIGVDFRSRTLEIDGKKAKLQIWDTAGQERFRTITSTYYRGAQGIILVYDVTNYASFENIQDWLHDVEKGTDENAKLCLIGNKADLVETKCVSTEEGLAYAKSVNIDFMECSAKTASNVDLAFVRMTKELLLRTELEKKYHSNAKSVDEIYAEKQKEKSKECCMIL